MEASSLTAGLSESIHAFGSDIRVSEKIDRRKERNRRGRMSTDEIRRCTLYDLKEANIQPEKTNANDDNESDPT